jgi:hypothetical protein
MLKKKIWPNFQRIIELFTQKIVTKLSKIWVLGSVIGDPGSGKNLFQIPDPGVKKAPDPVSRIRIRITEKKVVRSGSGKNFPLPPAQKCSESDRVQIHDTGLLFNIPNSKLVWSISRSGSESLTPK